MVPSTTSSDALPPPDELDTPAGPAQAYLFPAPRPRGQVVLTHGANGTVTTKDLLALTVALPNAGWSVALVQQSFAVAGRRTPPRPPAQDEAWIEALAALAALSVASGPLIVGGRSNGARVAARTASATGADGVLALAFPLHPPGKPDRSRADEMAGVYAANLPVLIVQGRTDAFGSATEVAAALPDPDSIVEVAGGHSFGKNPTDVVDAVTGWLAREWSGPTRR